MAAPVAPLVAAFQAAGFAMQVDLAPLATTAGMNAQIALMNAQLAALQAQLAAIGIPAIFGAVSANVQAIIAARAENNHSRNGVAYVMVPRADGTPPPHWPVGFDRAALRGHNAAVLLLVNDYGLQPPANPLGRRNALAQHIGTAGM
jgi:hypothetical protein